MKATKLSRSQAAIIRDAIVNYKSFVTTTGLSLAATAPHAKRVRLSLIRNGCITHYHTSSHVHLIVTHKGLEALIAYDTEYNDLHSAAEDRALYIDQTQPQTY